MDISLAAARLRAAHDRPYLAAALWNLIPVKKEGLGTLAVDKWWRVYYDPEFVAAHPVEVIAGVLIHEIGHVLREHHARAQCVAPTDPMGWNIAADAEINDDLLGEGIKLPQGVVVPSMFGETDGKMAEQYYETIDKQRQKNPAGNSCPVCNGGKSGKGQGPGQKGQGQQPGQGGGHGHYHGVAGGQCGSAAHGTQQEYELPGPDEAGGEQYEHVKEYQADMVRREVARQIQEAARTRGNVPAGWKRWADEKLKPRLNYKQIIAAAVRHGVEETLGQVNYTFMRPNRRRMDSEFVMPTMRQPVPEIALLIDTSGSMSDKNMSQAVGIVSGVLNALGCKKNVTVLSCDAAVHVTKKVFHARQVELMGGGGTDIGVGIAAMEKLKPKVKLGIIITDCYTPWPPKPKFNAVIIRVSQGEPPDWGRVITIEDDI